MPAKRKAKPKKKAPAHKMPGGMMMSEAEMQKMMAAKKRKM